MRISRISVNNFKSLVDFDLPMDKFTCLIGLNGSGKSTVLQFLDFLGQLMRGRMDDWYEDRRWDRYELRSHQLKSDSVSFEISFVDETGVPHGIWKGTYRVHLNRCDTERLEAAAHWLDVNTDAYTVSGEGAPHPIPFEYQGSIFSQLSDKVIPDSLRQVRDWIRSVRALDTLSSAFLRLPSEQSAKAGLGLAGRNLAASYEGLSKEHRNTATAALRELYPRFMNPVVH